jgi:hypothetical protein
MLHRLHPPLSSHLGKTLKYSSDISVQTFAKPSIFHVCLVQKGFLGLVLQGKTECSKIANSWFGVRKCGIGLHLGVVCRSWVNGINEVVTSNFSNLVVKIFCVPIKEVSCSSSFDEIVVLTSLGLQVVRIRLNPARTQN